LARPDDVTVFAVLLDDVEGVPRITAATIVTRFQGEPAVQEGEAYTSWTWAMLTALPLGLFVPCGQVLRARWPHLPTDHPPTHLYNTTSAGQVTAASAPQR
jgi:8-oxo-dGTP diphosphatase